MSADLIDITAERAVLGAVLADRRRFAEVAAMITTDTFGIELHGRIWAALLQADEDDTPFTTISVADVLRQRGDLEKVGGLAYLAELDSIGLSANALEYARLLVQAAQRRTLKGVGDRLAAAAASGGAPAMLAAEAEQALADSIIGAKGGALQPMPVVMDLVLDHLDKTRQVVGGVTGVATGFIELDRMLTGLHPGELIVLAARPGVGKTALAINMATHIAVTERKGAVVFSLEMPTDQLALRMLAAEAHVSLKRLREGGLSDHDMGKINAAAAKLYQAPMAIDDTAALGAFAMRTRMRNHIQRATTKPAVVVVDYLQLMGGTGNHDGREQEVAACSRGLKQLAKDFGVTVIALSQLNRKVEDRKDGRPRLSDLRESGAIEQDADAVLFIHEEQVEEPDAGPGAKTVEVIIAKQRNGPTGSVRLTMLAEYVKFESLARGY